MLTVLLVAFVLFAAYTMLHTADQQHTASQDVCSYLRCEYRATTLSQLN